MAQLRQGVERARIVSLGHLASVFGIAALLACPAFAGPPFRTDDPEPADYQHFELNLFS
jgi:hypothetical protein